MTVKIPYPVQFNPYKHHFGFLLDEIVRWQAANKNELKEYLQRIGNNICDFYLGALSCHEVCAFCSEYFKHLKINNKQALIIWLGNSDWKKISLPDHSEWLIKPGNLAQRYVHIHPAKYSEHTIRVRATTLKTVLALAIHQLPLQTNTTRNLQHVNQIRKDYLDLSPVKSVHKSQSGIVKLWQLFEDKSL
ncbi:hypothetical protein [uncultured Draconibacterium sp.]|uniref:hypothetical protein n=1 Tax=uncultured Draconibacterium sp. TaxID=1573823 RepID=UPI0025D6D7B5|nr:hypothetical protein [uncultured Draconibacterium sp.]